MLSTSLQSDTTSCRQLPFGQTALNCALVHRVTVRMQRYFRCPNMISVPFPHAHSLGAQITCRDCAKKRPPTAVFSFTNGQKLRSRWTAILGPQISLWRGNLARLSRTTIFSWPKTSLGAICVHMYTGGLQPLLPWWKVILKNQKIQPSFINACSLCNLRSCAYRLWTDDRGGGTSQWSRIVERITHGIVHAQIYSNSQNIHTRILIDLVVRYCMNSGSSESSDSDF